jgi:hypothetical protein
MPVTNAGLQCDQCGRLMPGSIYDSTGERIADLQRAGESPLFRCAQCKATEGGED